MYKPQPVAENDEYKLYCDRTILTDVTIHHNRPDLVLKYKKEALITDLAIPNKHNLTKTIDEETRKYQDLKIEMTRIWGSMKVHIVPLVMSTTGIVPTDFLSSVKLLDLDINIVEYSQKPYC